MEKTKNILRWILGAIPATIALFSGFRFATIIFIVAALLILPIAPIQKFIKEKIKLKNWLIIVIASVLFIAGLAALGSGGDSSTGGMDIETGTEQSNQESSLPPYLLSTDDEKSESSNSSSSSSSAQSSASSSASGSSSPAASNPSSSTPASSKESSAQASVAPSQPTSTPPSIPPVASQPEVGTTQIVYIAETGEKYHSRRDCRGLNNANAIYDVTLSEAQKNKTACKICYK